jgi:hypothetical protein
VGVDIFPGAKRECLFSDEELVPQLKVSIEEGGLPDMSDDGHYSIMSKNNSVADDFKTYRGDLAEKIKQTWADG